MPKIIDVASFLPTAFYKEKLPTETADNIQYVLDIVDIKETALFDKYRVLNNSQAIIDELGLGYLIKLVLLAGYTLAQLRGILVLLHHYKGTKFGVEMLLNLLGMTGLTGTASIVEWWESPTTPGLILPQAQRATPNTYKIKITMVNGTTPPVSVFQAFNELSPKYVLPSLDIGTVSTGTLPIYFEAMGRTNFFFHTFASDLRTPIQYLEAVGKHNVTIKTTAII